MTSSDPDLPYVDPVNEHVNEKVIQLKKAVQLLHLPCILHYHPIIHTATVVVA